jgi:hypothetical protein
VVLSCALAAEFQRVQVQHTPIQRSKFGVSGGGNLLSTIPESRC